MAKYSTVKTKQINNVTVVGDYCNFAATIEITTKGKIVFNKLKGGDEFKYLMWKNSVEDFISRHKEIVSEENMRIIFIDNKVNLKCDKDSRYATWYPARDDRAVSMYVDSLDIDIEVSFDECTNIETGITYELATIVKDTEYNEEHIVTLMYKLY